MILLIDAYNVLKSSSFDYITEHEREVFIAHLQDYAAQKGHQIVLVFDGGLSNTVEKKSHKRVLAVYPGHGESADEYIKEYLRVHKANEIVLISADRELTSLADRFGLVHVGGGDFYAFLEQALQQEGEILKSGLTKVQKMHKNHSHPEVDELMQEVYVPDIIDNGVHEERLSRKKGAKRTLSKRQKKIASVLKKL